MHGTANGIAAVIILIVLLSALGYILWIITSPDGQVPRDDHDSEDVP